MGKSGRVVWPSEREAKCKLSVSVAVEAEAETEKGEENLRSAEEGELRRVEEKQELQRLGFMNWKDGSFRTTTSIILSFPNLRIEHEQAWCRSMLLII